MGKVQVEARRLRVQKAAKRSSLELASRGLFHGVARAEQVSRIARLELDFQRENLDVVLARFDEGRVSLEDVERARLEEKRAWVAYYDARYAARTAKLDLLRHTGDLVTALR